MTPYIVLGWKTFVALHIVVGLVGLVSFWVPIVGRKGGATHRSWGKVFTVSMLGAGGCAVGISLCTLLAPMETHESFPDSLRDATLLRAIFGWMMLYLALLTINLVWYGWQCVRNRRDHLRNREWRNLLLQALVFVAACNVVGQGLWLGQPLMMGASVVGFATVGTNLRFIFGAAGAWQREHLKALIGAGISIYTAFLALGAVRLVPSLALSPQLWALPLTAGVGLILYHWRRLPRATPRGGLT